MRFKVPLAVGVAAIAALFISLTVYFTLHQRLSEAAEATQAFTVQFSPDLGSFDEFFRIRRRALRATADAISSHRGLPSTTAISTVCVRIGLISATGTPRHARVLRAR